MASRLPMVMSTLVTDSTCILTSVANAHSELEKHDRASPMTRPQFVFIPVVKTPMSFPILTIVCAQFGGH